MRVERLRKTLRNLDDEATYIATDDSAAARLVVKRVLDAVAQLADQPGMGRPGRVPGTRELIDQKTRYVAPYRVRGERVEMLRVFHASRRLPARWQLRTRRRRRPAPGRATRRGAARGTSGAVASERGCPVAVASRSAALHYHIASHARRYPPGAPDALIRVGLPLGWRDHNTPVKRMLFDFEPRLVLLRVLAAGVAVGALGACSSGPATLPNVATETPTQWQAPLPHTGQLTALGRWWQQFDDPVLVQLIDAAQAVSPSIASAASHIEQSRAARVAAGAALLPALDANASASRGRQAFITALGNTASVGVQSAWEFDLFGGLGDARDAAQARLEGAQAAWHDARVAVAAEVATDYTSLRACEAQVRQAQADRASRRETARLTDLSMKAGFETPANAALAQASAAQSNNALTQRRAQCDVLVKGLVALTGVVEPALRTQLAPGRAHLPQPAQIVVASVPAQALAQRPDLRGAEHRECSGLRGL